MRLRTVRRSSLLVVLAAAGLGLVLMTPRIGGPLERALEPVRFGLHHHAASGRVVVVEMDAGSAAAIGRWPWPRRHHAAVVDRLRAAGAASVVFDVDVSAASNPADDAALAAALGRARGLVALPTFSQLAEAGDGRHLDLLPLPAFRDRAALASVSVRPDVDGLVREMPLATVTSGVPRPSLSAYIAARAGTADIGFPVDFSIDPAGIPRLSFVAVRDGRFDPAAVHGRDVLIGATAVEMGDRYATPTRGVLPGVVIQALAAETLKAGVPSRGSGWPVLLAALLVAAAATAAPTTRGAAARTALGAGAIGAAVAGAQDALLVYYPLGLGLVVVLAAGLLAAARNGAERLREERATDAATGLPNARAFPVSDAGEVAVVQLNNLDALEAVLGADGLAQAVVRTAERLRLLARDGLVCRVHSHHLALTLADGQPADDALAALRALLLEPVEVAGRKVDVAAAAGVAPAGDDCLANAAIAAERATREGVFWRRATASRDSLERDVSLMGELDAAVAAGQLLVHYQPKLRLETGRIEGAEALVRWQHPTRGFVPPDLFVPLAEQTDRIAPLTLAVLDTVLADLAGWRARGIVLAVAVNISARLLSSPAFNDAVDRRLAAAAVPPGTLVFEVTESAAMSDPESAAAALRGYRDRGIAVSMDDYGTGQSTLSYLQRLPLSELKIDRSFVSHAHRRQEDAVLVRSTVELAHRLGLKVVAEGVEEAAGIDFLRSLGCDYVQGYFVSRPVPREALEALLRVDGAEPTLAA